MNSFPNENEVFFLNTIKNFSSILTFVTVELTSLHILIIVTENKMLFRGTICTVRFWIKMSKNH